MYKKTISILFSILFFVLSVCPVVGFFVFGPSAPVGNEQQAGEPKLLLNDGSFNTSVTQDVTKYISDHFGFRNQLINAWAELNSAVFHVSAEEQVLLGSDGWLYFSLTTDDYMGRGMNETELRRVARNLYLMQEYVEKIGAEFLFTIAPNKNSLYPEHMPRFVPSAHEKANAARLVPLLREYGVSYVDLFAPFSEENDTLYYQTDSHWTDRGAALAADVLLKETGRTSDYFAGPFSDADPHRGDLYSMLYPTGKAAESAVYYAPGFTYTLAGDDNNGEAITISAENIGKSGNLLCWRDSFGISLYPYLADSFSESSFDRHAAYNLTEVESKHADTVLIELVERNLSWLLTYVPVYSAPLRHIDRASVTASEQTVSVSKRTDKTSGLVCFSGTVPEGCIPETAYVTAGDRAYEAHITQAEGKWLFHAYLEEGTAADALYLEQGNEVVLYPFA